GDPSQRCRNANNPHLQSITKQASRGPSELHNSRRTCPIRGQRNGDSFSLHEWKRNQDLPLQPLLLSSGLFREKPERAVINELITRTINNRELSRRRQLV